MIIFQQPRGKQSLLKSMLASASTAEFGIGYFAWATEAGARLFLEDELTTALIDEGKYKLIVGVDAVTNIKALEFLGGAQERHHGLQISVFHDPEGSLFHPKLTWFGSKASGTLILGSGNLTVGGLLRNWEAFTVTELQHDAFGDLTSTIEEFTEEIEEYLYPVDDPEIRKLAAKNTGFESLLRTKSSQRTRVQKSKHTSTSATEEILIAELPLVRDRISQANFDLYHFENYFGADPSTATRIALYELLDDGSVGTLESRRTVTSKSQNYRIELSGLRGRPYPKGNFIAVFRRIGVGVFLYWILAPGDEAFNRFIELLGPKTGASMRRRTFSAEELKRLVGHLPIMFESVPLE